MSKRAQPDPPAALPKARGASLAAAEAPPDDSRLVTAPSRIAGVDAPVERDGGGGRPPSNAAEAEDAAAVANAEVSRANNQDTQDSDDDHRSPPSAPPGAKGADAVDAAPDSHAAGDRTAEKGRDENGSRGGQDRSAAAAPTKRKRGKKKAARETNAQAVMIMEEQKIAPARKDPVTIVADVLQIYSPPEFDIENNVGLLPEPLPPPHSNNNNENQNTNLLETTPMPETLPANPEDEPNNRQQFVPSSHCKKRMWIIKLAAATIAMVVIAIIISVVVAASSSEADDDPMVATSATVAPTQFTQTRLEASDGDADDNFGRSVAIHGDTIVIGADGDTENGFGSGSAYVYTLSGTVWTEHAKLTESDSATNDWFGISVAIDGDTIVIGAVHDYTKNGFDRGSAYVYTLSGMVWTEEAKLTASDGAELDQFGNSVAVDSDIIVIGASLADNGSGSNSGSAYVYTRSGSVWTEQSKLTASDGAVYFGCSVAINGDTIVIGASLADNNSSSNSGSAYVYTHSGAVWTEQAKLTASDGASGDGFGSSVAIYGDTIVIGAPEIYKYKYYGSGGRAYVYTLSGTVWTEKAKFTASDGATDHNFGYSVAIHGDIIVIGDPRSYLSKNDFGGNAYVFTRSGSAWIEEAKLTASDADTGDRFGNSVAIDGDTLVIGAYYDDTENERDSGSAYIFG